MTRLLNLFVLLAPWVALLGGAALLGLAALHLLRLRPLPGIAPEQVLAATSALTLGVAILGLGVTYLLTAGAVGYDDVYLAWLMLAALSGALGVIGGR